MLIVTLVLASTSPGMPVELLPIAEIHIAGRELALDDFTNLSSLPARDRAALGPQVVATLAKDRNIAEVSSDVLESWARRKVPGLRFQAMPVRPIKITYGNQHIGFSQPDNKPMSGCSMLSSPANDGDILVQSRTRPVQCDDRLEAAAVYFDRKDKVVRAAQNLSAGAYLGRIALPDTTIADRGREMIFVAYNGPVRVERNVRALQAAKSGQRLFVTTEDGSVFATRYRVAGETKQ